MQTFTSIYQLIQLMSWQRMQLLSTVLRHIFGSINYQALLWETCAAKQAPHGVFMTHG